MMETKEKPGGKPEWMEIISRYNKPDNLRSWWQILNSVGAYLVMWVVMIWSLKISYLLTLAL